MINAQQIASGLVNAAAHQWEEGTFPMLGVASKKHVWFWFILIDNELYFDHAYSQNNGVTSKAFETRKRAENLLTNLSKY